VTKDARPGLIRRHWRKLLVIAIIIGLIVTGPLLFVFIVVSILAVPLAGADGHVDD
jgi:hypothetical protein